MLKWRTIKTLQDEALTVAIRFTVGIDNRPWYSIQVGNCPTEDNERVLPFIPVRNTAESVGKIEIDDACDALAALLQQVPEHIEQHHQEYYERLAERDTPRDSRKQRHVMRPGKTQRDREKRNARNV